MAEEEYERFEITDYDLDNEFNPNRNRKRPTKKQQIYGETYNKKIIKIKFKTFKNEIVFKEYGLMKTVKMKGIKTILNSCLRREKEQQKIIQLQ
jgi:hypothetical protein